MTNRQWIKIFTEERDAVVRTMDIKKFKEFFNKWKTRGFYNIELPNDDKVLEITLRKMAFHSPRIPEDERKEAEKWLTNCGYTTDL